MDTPTSFPRRRFSPVFKAEVLQACSHPGASIADIAQQFGLTTDLTLTHEQFQALVLGLPWHHLADGGTIRCV